MSCASAAKGANIALAKTIESASTKRPIPDRSIWRRLFFTKFIAEEILYRFERVLSVGALGLDVKLRA